MSASDWYITGFGLSMLGFLLFGLSFFIGEMTEPSMYSMVYGMSDAAMRTYLQGSRISSILALIAGICFVCAILSSICAIISSIYDHFANR